MSGTEITNLKEFDQAWNDLKVQKAEELKGDAKFNFSIAAMTTLTSAANEYVAVFNPMQSTSAHYSAWHTATAAILLLTAAGYAWSGYGRLNRAATLAPKNNTPAPTGP